MSDPFRTLSIVRDPRDPVAAAPPVGWAVDQLRENLAGRGLAVGVTERLDAVDEDELAILVAGRDEPDARRVLAVTHGDVPRVPEALGLVPGRLGDRELLLACGADVRGLVYAVLDLADRVAHAEDPLDAIRMEGSIVEEPANAVRSVARLFCSELEDKRWFHDEAFWRGYLSMLVAQRFNRFSLTLGLGYNFPRHVTDAYLYFAYPFLLSVPGYDVRVPQLAEGERERNLEMLRFVSEQAAARALDFQLGLWTHAYEWTDSPNAHHTIEGLRPDNHAAYCRDALRVLLESCPAIGGLTLRIHGESGIAERSWEFWRIVLDGVVRSGRRVGIDLHAKGLDAETLEIALETGLPVTVSPKYWAEHMGLPYHQASIRELERPKDDRPPASEWERFMAVSVGSRPFTRYGFSDFLRDDRPYEVVFRLWPGSQRLLQWGDPAMAAGYGRSSTIAGASGIEWFEPLSFKGREGSGLPGSRTGYADASLVPGEDWEKFTYAYRLLGRLTYDPDADPETWRRDLRARLGGAARAAEDALANASRILPLVTTAHHPSASNNFYWPEIYTDMPIVGQEGKRPAHPYVDTPSPRRFGTVGALDPELFSSVAEFVRDVLAGQRSGRYSPLDVAGWLERLSENAARHLIEMEAQLDEPGDPFARRLVADVAIQEALGRFFSQKMQAAVLFELSVQTRNSAPLRDALDAYRAARSGWVDAAQRATGVYVDDLTFGPEPHLRGHWADRLASIERDIEAMTDLSHSLTSRSEEPEAELRRLVEEAGRRSSDVTLSHTPPPTYRTGSEIPLSVEVDQDLPTAITAVRLRYRHLDQSQDYVDVEMAREASRFVGVIPGSYSASPYPLAYFFIPRDARGHAWPYPGLGADLSDQPYYVLRADGAGSNVGRGSRGEPQMGQGTLATPARGVSLRAGPENVIIRTYGSEGGGVRTARMVVRG